jgi:hypothetical protein
MVVVETIIYFTDIRGNARLERAPGEHSGACEDQKMENQDLRRRGVFSCILTFDATNVLLDGTSLVCAVLMEQTVKHGKLPVSISSII